MALVVDGTGCGGGRVCVCVCGWVGGWVGGWVVYHMAQVVEVDDEARYLHATGKSKVPKDGVDDVEFLMVPDEKIFTTRSVSLGKFFFFQGRRG